MYPVLNHAPSAVGYPRRLADLFRGLVSPAVLPAVACMICAAATPGFRGWGILMMFAVFFTIRAVFVGASGPRMLPTPVGPARLLPGSPSRGPSVDAELAVTVSMATPAPIMMLGFAGFADLATGFLGGLLLLAFMLATTSVSRWIPYLVSRRDRHALFDLPDVLRTACGQGLLIAEGNGYRFTDPAVAMHFSRATPTPQSAGGGLWARQVASRLVGAKR